MPGRPRKTTTEQEPCTECFPQGWPADAVTIACGHGHWTRTATEGTEG